MNLHLACGKRYIPGFIHVDVADFPHIDYRSRIERLPMFADASADLIYCCHGLEYLDRAEAAAALIEWRRVLKAGGTLRHKELLAPFGLDASKPEFWAKGLHVVEGFIDELEQMS